MDDYTELVKEKGPWGGVGVAVALIISRLWPKPKKDPVDAIDSLSQQLEAFKMEMNANISKLSTQIEVMRSEAVGRERLTEHRLDQLEHELAELRSLIQAN